MDANSLKKAAEISSGIDEATAALAKIDDYFGQRKAKLTGGVEVNVPVAPGRPPNEDQTIHTAPLRDYEHEKMLACLKGIFEDRITELNSQIAAL